MYAGDKLGRSDLGELLTLPPCVLTGVPTGASSGAMDDAMMIPFLKHLAAQSAEVITPLFNNPALDVEWKEDKTPVTYADKKAEEVLRALIAKEFPDHGIIGEEFPSVNPDAPYTWVLDPIDGTRSFAAGSPHFGTLIALRQGDEPIWGAINLPVQNELYLGNNTQAWMNDRPVQVRETGDLRDCFLLTTDPKRPYLHHDRSGWDALLATTDQYRSWGDCFGYTLIARGGADIMCDPAMSLWDQAALLPVIRGSGAALTDWQGNTPVNATSLVAAHPRHHARIIALLNPAQDGELATGYAI